MYRKIRNKTQRTKLQILQRSTLEPNHKCPATESKFHNCKKKGYFPKVSRFKIGINKKSENLRRLKKAKKVNRQIDENRNKTGHQKKKPYYKGYENRRSRKKFIVNAGSPVTITPPGKEITLKKHR